MKLFVLTYMTAYSDGATVEGVYSSEEKAQEVIDNDTSTSRFGWNIVECELDV